MSKKKKKVLPWHAGLMPYQKEMIKMLTEHKATVIYCGGKNAGKTLAAKVLAMKQLMDQGKIQIPADGEFYNLMKEHAALIDATMGIPQSMMNTKHSTAAEVNATNLTFNPKPHPLDNYTYLNIVTFDACHGKGWKLNLLTGHYEES